MKFWQSYGAHLLGYVAAAVGVAEAIPTASIAKVAPTLAPYVGPTGIVALVAIAAGITTHAVTASASPTSTPTSAPVAPAAAKLLPLLLVLGALPFLHGCATLAAPTATDEAVVQAVVDVAVATAEQKGVSAAQINSLAKQALAADSGATASLAAIAGVVNGELATLNLPAGDLAAAQILEAALEVAIDERVGTNATLAQTQAAAADIIQSVITATGG